jgi:hypothetical protein
VRATAEPVAKPDAVAPILTYPPLSEIVQLIDALAQAEQRAEKAEAERDALKQDKSHLLSVVAEYRERNDVLKAENTRLREQKNACYIERDQLVCALSKVFPAGLSGILIAIYTGMTTGAGSCSSTCLRARHRGTFTIPSCTGSTIWDGLKVASGDGHTTEEKYRRLQSLEANRQFRAAPEPTGGAD